MMIAAAPHSRSLAVRLFVCFVAMQQHREHLIIRQIKWARHACRHGAARTTYMFGLLLLLFSFAEASCATQYPTLHVNAICRLSSTMCNKFFFFFFEHNSIVWTTQSKKFERKKKTTTITTKNKHMKNWKIMMDMSNILQTKLLNCFYIQIILSILLWNGDFAAFEMILWRHKISMKSSSTRFASL